MLDPIPSIDRPALHDRFETAAAGGGKVLLLCAAAGTGKTVAIADWLRRRPHYPGTVVGRLAIDERLDDAGRLWEAVHDCLALPAPAHDDHSGSETTPVANLIAALDDPDVPRVLIIDDAHRLTDPPALAGLEYFLRYPPTAVIVVVCARFDPPLRWHTLELSGVLTRFGSADLALTETETRLLCAQHGCRLDDAELAEVMALTHGWVALVRITARYLAAHGDDPRAAPAMLTQPPPAVSDFLLGELVDALPVPLRQFLLYTSIPVSFTPRLAEALAGPSARHLLHELERVNYPMTRTTRDNELWLSYHPMLRSHFRAEIRHAGVELADDLNLRAAAWYDDAGLPLSALPHLLDDSAHDRLVEFLRRRGMAIVLDGAGARLFAQLDSLRPALSEDPFIWLLRAIDALTHGDATSATTYLAMVRIPGGTGDSVVPAAWLPPLALAARVDAALLADDMAALPGTGPHPAVGHPDIDCYLTIQLATAMLLRGDREGGEEQLQRGLALAESTNHPQLALRSVTRLAMSAAMDGAVTTMRDRAGRALAIAAEYGLEHCADAAHATALAGFAAYLQGDSWPVEQTAELLTMQEHLDGSVRPAAGWSAHVVGRLLACQTEADHHTAVEELRRAMLSLLTQGGPLPMTPGRLLTHVVWALLAVREPRTARLLIEQARAAHGDRPEVELSRAALALVTSKPATVDVVLEPLLADDTVFGVADRVTLWLLYAVRHEASRSPYKVRRALEMALAYAAPDCLVRPFLDVPDAIAVLDGQAGSFGHHDDFVDRVRHHPLARRRSADQQLTATEMTVLKHLPSGRTAQQIAVDLGVSVNTVKTHLRGIYAKLGVNSRTAALDKARRAGLL
ncbi:LuxR C-terminal-related transcriptional regulator [Nocardia huaxiensis]|uniref:LuxR C-terminal-related transcriptional regulator n=1 Tax=Nocardia huaxiensis TaxID=2755382 RepID=UPI001E600CC2|nr:LuxR C-terminal-related transcriptional regulator [Nocardia huaxiensis]UFS93239.1 LuxR C-terminal-related transcriptional regulator [Nocardia huaxiensis]